MAVNSNPTGASRASESARGFKRYDQCSFAILVELERGRRLLISTAHYQRDDLLGSILRFSLEAESPGKPEIIIAEKEWNGLITCGRRYHCDYCLTLSRTESTSYQLIDDLPRNDWKIKNRGSGK